MLSFRLAKKADKDTILKILKGLDLYCPGQPLDNFWVAEKENQTLGVVQFQDWGDFFFLSSLGVASKAQHQGIASFMMKKLIKKADKAIYLYTVIPEFFTPFGFKTTPPLSSLPSKSAYQCQECFPEKCVCMLKLPNASCLPAGRPEYPAFKALEIENYAALTKHLNQSANQICELCPANFYIWQDFDRPQITLIHGNLCVLIHPLNEKQHFLEPIGKNKFVETADICLKYAGAISRASENYVLQLPKEKYQVAPLRNQFDYVYLRQELAELKGKKFDGKRNHIKRFKSTHPNYEYLPFKLEYKDAAQELFEKWFEAKKESRFFPRLAHTAQKNALNATFKHFEKLGILGGAIFIDKALIGFILGSALNAETISAHFSYADPSVQRTSQVLLWETCNKTFSAYRYINLEQDLGIPGLRAAKLSYHPLRLEKKFEVKAVLLR